MRELDKKFVEPVVLGTRPFETVADVARDAMLRTQKLVAKLTGSQREDEPPAELADSAQRIVKER